MRVSKSIVLLLIVLIFGSCLSEIENKIESKLWKHRVNSITELKEATKNFRGIEVDVVFESSLNEFNVRHDIEAPISDLSLDSFFESINQGASNYFYWLDFKNLTIKIHQQAIAQLEYLIKKYGLEDRIFIESWNTGALFLLKEKGFQTVNWITQFDYNKDSISNYKDQFEKINLNIAKMNFTALSCFHEMYEFVDYYFTDKNIFLWTNGLISEKDKERILYLEKRSNVKVILVDYSYDFTQRNENEIN